MADETFNVKGWLKAAEETSHLVEAIVASNAPRVEDVQNDPFIKIVNWLGTKEVYFFEYCPLCGLQWYHEGEEATRCCGRCGNHW